MQQLAFDIQNLVTKLKNQNFKICGIKWNFLPPKTYSLMNISSLQFSLEIRRQSSFRHCYSFKCHNFYRIISKVWLKCPIYSCFKQYYFSFQASESRVFSNYIEILYLVATMFYLCGNTFFYYNSERMQEKKKFLH